MKRRGLLTAIVLVAACSAVTTGTASQTAPVTKPGGEAPKPAPPPEAVAKSTDPKVNPDAEILVDFKKRIDKYLDVRKKAVAASAQHALPLKKTADPDKIGRAQDALAATIRMLRWDAHQGDIFTPEIREKFVQLMYPQLKGEHGHDTKEILKDDAPSPSKLVLKVNADYPEGPLPTVPANILASLPTLPKELDYRIVGGSLILRDVKANLIVDYMPNVVH